MSSQIWDIHITGKKNSICTSAFSYKSKEKHEIYVTKKCCEEKRVDLLLIGGEGKRHQVLIKDFNTLMHDYIYIVEENIIVAIAYKLLV